MDFTLDNEWESFLASSGNILQTLQPIQKNVDPSIVKKSSLTPTCTKNHISTKTMIAFMNQSMDIESIFWKMKTIPYYHQGEGIVQKQMKITSSSEEKTNEIYSLVNDTQQATITKIQHIPESNIAPKRSYKYVGKVNVGMSTKNALSTRQKEKGAFYNCFAVVVRIFDEPSSKFKEVHIKLFNTGKMEIPGIQKDYTLHQAVNVLIEHCKDYVHSDKPLDYNKDDISSVLINSNFKCNYHINRDIMYHHMTHKYGINCSYDACTYPGIKCKFYINKDTRYAENGVCKCDVQCGKRGKGNGKNACIEVSVMIFRTGSILMVGNCSEEDLKYIYGFFTKMLIDDFEIFYDDYETTNQCNGEEKVKKARKRKMKITQMV